MGESKYSRYNLIMYAIILLFIGTMILDSCNNHIKSMMLYDEYWRLYAFVPFVLLFILCFSKVRKNAASRVDRQRPAIVFWFGWYLCFIGIVVAGLLNTIADQYLIWTVLCLTFIPGILFAFSSDKAYFTSFLTILSKAMVAGSFAFAGMNYAFAPFTKRAPFEPMYEYLGLVIHPNSNGLLCSGFVVAAAYLLVTDKKYKLVYAVSIGISMSIIIAANCRAAELGLLLALIAGLTYYLRQEGLPNKKLLAKAGACLVLAVVICVPSFALLRHIDQMDLNAKAPETEVAAEEIATEQEEVNDVSHENGELSLYGRINRLSSDRLTIWKAYISELKPLGNGKATEPVTDANMASYSAHNNILAVFYVSGFPAGIGFVIWIVYALCFIIRKIIVKDVFRPQTLFFMLSFSVYFVEAMLEVMQYPFFKPVVLMAYLSLPATAFVSGDYDTAYRIIKRVFDILVGIIGCLLLLPLSVCIKAAQLLTGDRGPVFYVQTRIGYKGELFKIYKYRSMVAGADEMLDELLEEEALRNQWTEKQKLDNDPRITKAGKILRKTSIDELPQLLNVLKGDMSLVGPRPLVPGELEEHDGDLMYQDVKPGMTGWWICNGHYDMEYGERLAYEYYYVNNCSLRLDIICIFKTILSALRG